VALVFIGGFLRTGTTLLQTILCSSPQGNPMIGEARNLNLEACGVKSTVDSCYWLSFKGVMSRPVAGDRLDDLGRD